MQSQKVLYIEQNEEEPREKGCCACDRCDYLFIGCEQFRRSYFEDCCGRCEDTGFLQWISCCPRSTYHFCLFSLPLPLSFVHNEADFLQKRFTRYLCQEPERGLVPDSMCRDDG
mmetsp:Transcript_37013/g.60060  ORF Transcript_37013/g.60060 Transcript_37013/m.60060 type:complete len:114 (+) Transcript_37013:145-486(+)